MTNPEISVIIPTYNCSEYLEECLDSLLAQTYKDYELVIVDDGSTDATRDIVRRYASADPVHFVTHFQENHGASHARNVGMDICHGTYVAFVDGDDVVLPDYLETLHNAAVDGDCDLVTASYEKYEGSIDNVVESRIATDWTVTFPDGNTHTFQYSPCAKIIRRDLLNTHGIRFVEGEILEDCPFGILTNSLAHNQAVLSYAGYKYRKHEGSVQAGVRKGSLSKTKEGKRYPFGGLNNAAKAILAAEKDTYYRPLEYVMCKALAGIVFYFGKSGSKEDLRYVCDQCSAVLDTYFPSISHKDTFIKVGNCKELPLYHRVANSLFRFGYLKGCLHPLARAVQIVSNIVAKGE